MTDASWMQEGACAGSNPETWFSEDPDLLAYAKSVCATCTQRVRCLDWAVTNHEIHGTYGGLSARERERVRRKRWKANAAERNAS